MNAFKRKSLYLAVVAGLGSVGMADTASAVNINNNGTGQVLIFPYYTVRGGTNTYLSVVNTTSSAKAVKVRFTEGRNSREVLDFNLYMSPNDVFAGVITPTSSGANFNLGTARTPNVASPTGADTSCTYPAIPAGGVDFVNYAYSGSNLAGMGTSVGSQGDWETTSLDRTREGYFEIIEMGVITNTDIIAAITHNSAGFPANCSVVQQDVTGMNMGAGSALLWPLIGGTSQKVDPPKGGLTGTASLVNVNAGTDYGYSPVPLADFNGINNLWNAAGTIAPDLTNAYPYVSRVFKGGAVVATDWTNSTAFSSAQRPVNAVSAVLMHDNLINEFVMDTATQSATDWVITMPTKRYYVPAALTQSTAGYISPFTKSFSASGACETVSITYWDREEQLNTTPSTFSPPPPSGGPTSLCWESTVVTFTNTGGTSVLGSSNGVSFPVTYSGGTVKMQHGWAKMNFAQTMVSGATVAGTVYSGTAAAVTSSASTYVGLPTIGFMVTNALNGNVGTPAVLSNYGGNFNHSYTNNITVGGVAVTGE